MPSAKPSVNNGLNGLDAHSLKIRKRLRFAGLLVILGLVVEGLTLFWHHPTAFVVFAVAGMTLVLLGMVIYVWAVLFAGPGEELETGPPAGASEATAGT